MKNSKTSLKILSTTLASVMFFNSNFAGAAEPADKSKKSSFGSGFLAGMTVASVISALGAMAAYKYLDPKAKDKKLEEKDQKLQELKKLLQKQDISQVQGILVEPQQQSKDDDTEDELSKLRGLCEELKKRPTQEDFVKLQQDYKKIFILMLAHELEIFVKDPANGFSEDYVKMINCIPESTKSRDIYNALYALYKYRKNQKTPSRLATADFNSIMIAKTTITPENRETFLSFFEKTLPALYNEIDKVSPKTIYENLLLTCLKKDFLIKPKKASE